MTTPNAGVPALAEELTVQQLLAKQGLNFCVEPACQKVTGDPSRRCTEHRKQLVRVYIYEHDLCHLDDCDDVIFDLLQSDGISIVQIDMIADVKRIRSKMLDGFGPDVKLKERELEGGGWELQFDHQRGKK